MGKDKTSVTPAIRALREQGVEYEICPYSYEDKGGTEVASRELGIDEHLAIKTLVMEDEHKNAFLVLMHGDKQVSTKTLARAVGVKQITPCDPATAQKHTGYMVGGISPFGTKKRLRVYVEETILALPEIFINAGRRGLLVRMSPAVLNSILQPIAVRVARE